MKALSLQTNACDFGEFKAEVAGRHPDNLRFVGS